MVNKKIINEVDIVIDTLTVIKNSKWSNVEKYGRIKATLELSESHIKKALGILNKLPMEKNVNYHG